MFGYGFGRGYRRGMHMGPGMGMGPMGFGGPGPCWWDLVTSRETDVELLKRYKDRLEFHRKELDAEIEAVEKRIQELQK